MNRTRKVAFTVKILDSKKNVETLKFKVPLKIMRRILGKALFELAPFTDFKKKRSR